MLAACSGDPEAWSLKLLTIVNDPGTMSSPAIAHDLELERNGCQLRAGRVTYCYCEFFSQVAPYIVWESCG